jgi:LmbE family N-acetylglucosaminyl deacetylase
VPAHLLDDPGGPVLAVYAHPDDPDVSCGGTLARWARAGAEVHVLICTDGDKGTLDPSVDPVELAHLRAAEAAEAAGLLGVASQRFLGYPDGELADDAELRGSLVRWVRTLRPRTVLGPDPTAVFFGEDYYNHRDHRIIGLALLDALSPAHYFPDAGAAHQAETALLSGTLEPTVWVDVSDTIEDKAAAVSCHRSQFADGGEWARHAVHERAREDGRAAGVPYAEGFRRLRLGG